MSRKFYNLLKIKVFFRFIFLLRYVRAESARRLIFNMKVSGYAKVRHLFTLDV
jgi:hypothetical protein